MDQNDLATDWIRTRQRAVRQRVHRVVQRTVDGPLVPVTRQYVSEIPPGLAGVVAQLGAELGGRDRTDGRVQAVGTALAFVSLHLRVHATAAEDGNSDAILAGDLLRALADRTICRSSLSSETIQTVSTACAAASRRGLEEYSQTGDADAMESSTFVDASRAGAAVSDADWLPAFVAAVTDDGATDAASLVPAAYQGDTRVDVLERLLCGDVR